MRTVALVTLAVLASPALADDYPKVVHRDGQVCVQSLDAAGAVVEQCRREGAAEYSAPAQLTPPDAPPLPPPQAAPPPAQPRRSARLIEDEHGAARGIAEVVLGQLAGLVPVLVASATCNSLLTSCTGASVAGGLISFVASSLTVGLIHLAFDGRAGMGWSFLGNLIGGSVGLLLSLVAVSSGSAVLLLMAGIVQILLPSTCSAIALEVRDRAVRKQEAGLAGRAPHLEEGLLAARF